MKIKPKLYLNGSPQTAEEGSLAFARNMKVDNDGNLVSDYGYKNISALQDYNIVGHIVGLDNKIYLFTENEILEYDEISENVDILKTGWKYNGGEISGYVSTNISGEKILTIGEYKEDINIPLKHINLSYCKDIDDESLYCQAPICPTANLILNTTYVKTIPNGVYVFFIRYKIRKDVYTNWFLCSRPIYAGVSEKISTFQGGLQYINLHRDSAKSFIFDLNFVQEENKQFYKEFQLGFIITHDEATDARTWKHFDIDTKTIYFDYEEVKETNIDDLLKTTYELYNVKNITAFKNKLYISNYKETNFNIKENILDFLELKVTTTTEETNTEVKTAKLGPHILQYDNNLNCFTKNNNNNKISDILLKNYFNYDISNLSNKESIISDKVVANITISYRFSITGGYLAIINNIENNLYNKCIFGNNFSIDNPKNTDPNSNDELAPTGLYCKEYNKAIKAYLYTPVVNGAISYNSKNHPLYHLGYSFAFGQTDNSSNYLSYTFNAYTKWYMPVAGRGYFWKAYGNYFKDDHITYIKNTLTEEIKNRSFFAKAYIKISVAGGNTYKIGYKEVMDSNTSNYAGNNMDFNILHRNPFTSENTCERDYREHPYKYYIDSDLIILNPSYFNTDFINSELKNKIEDWAFNIIKDKCIGITTEGIIKLDLSEYGGTISEVTAISIVFKKINFDVEIEEIEKSDSRFKYKFKIKMNSDNYTSLCKFKFNSSLIINSSNEFISKKPTLMPFSKYRFYIHFVDNRNIITNGIKVTDIETKGLSLNNNGVINDKDCLDLFYKIKTNKFNTYKSFFISIKNIGDIIIEGFGYKKLGNNTHILNFLELDTLLYNINNNITIINNDGELITNNASYYSSGNSNPPLAFGNCGYVSWEEENNSKDYTNTKLYIKIERVIDNIDKNNLIKASGFIDINHVSEDFEKIPDAYYGSWFCSITKPDFTSSSSCYVSGKDIYVADRNFNPIKLKDFEDFVAVSSSPINYIRSNFNLNYLSLTEDITDSIFSIGSASNGNKQVAKVINSAILSYIYELKSMYKDFMNKTFSAYDEDYKIQFDNTIRVSNVLSDETFNNSIFKFDSTDYYNIPTDRGVIVSLFAIGNTIYAHTKGSLYKFDATQTISSTTEDIKLQEAEPFEIGISQVFDSQYGYGGIENKEAGCITFDSYFFYDNRSNHIFAYSGNSQIQLIDGSIYKFLTYYKPTICKTVHDIVNKRILFEFTLPINTEISNPIITLSYNYKSKSFVSIHDITLNNCFTSINTVYSYNNNFIKLFDTTDYYISQELLFKPLNLYKLYGSASERSYLIFNNITNPFSISIIIFPQQYLKEVLNSISYIGNIIEKDITSNSGRTEDGIRYSYNNLNICITKPENPTKCFNVLTDICESNIINYTINDTNRPNSLLDYKGFKYDKGTWNINYFRNTNNNSDIYKYNDVESDNKSLIYGKFFILNFSFITDKPVKFEEVFINSEKY